MPHSVMRVFLDIARGDVETQQGLQKQHAAAQEWLRDNHVAYGLPGRLDELSDADEETVRSLYEGVNVRCSTRDLPATLITSSLLQCSPAQSV